MANKINVKKMDYNALSDYNKASVELVKLSEAKSAELKPLREKKAQILAERTKALAVEGSVLDEVLKEYSIDGVEAEISAVNFKYAEPMRECVKAQNKVLRLVNPNTFYSYAVSMDSMDSLFKATGEFSFEKKTGELETIKITSKDTFYACIKSLYEDLGALGTDDDKAMDKVVRFHAKRIGGLKFDRKSQDNVLKKKSELVNSLIRDIITYLVGRGVVVVAEDGGLTVA